MRRRFAMRALALLALTLGAAGWTSITHAADEDPGPITAADVTLDRPADFREDILPILRTKCLACHSASKKEGGLILESAELLRKGGDSGAAVVAGNPDESLLVLSAGRSDDGSPMPPLPNDANAKAVTPQELGLIRLWIREGAKDAAAAAKAMNWQPLPATINGVYSLALDPQEQIVAAGRANQIHLYDIVRQRELAVLGDPALTGDSTTGPIAHRDIVSSLAFSPDGKWLASGGYRVVKLWQRSDPQLQRREIGTAVSQIVTSADGRWLAVGLADGSIRLIDQQSDADAAVLTGLDTPPVGLAFTADGTRLLSAAGTSLRLWDVATQQSVGELTLPAPVRSLLMIAEPLQVATGHEDGTIRLWSLDQIAAGKDTNAEAPPAAVKELSGHGKPVTSLAWMVAEGPRLVSGSEDGTLRQWDIAAGTETRQIAHGGPVTVIATTTDGTRLVSAGADGIARIWDTKGTKIAEVSGDPRPAAALAERQADLKVAQSRKAIAEQAVTDGEKDSTERTESLKKAQELVTTTEKQVAEAKPKVEAAQAQVDAAAASLTEMPEDEARKKAKTDTDAALAKEQGALTKAEDALVSAKRGVELSEKSLAAVNADLTVRKQRRDVEVASEQAATAAVAAAQEAAKPQPTPVRGLAFAPDGSWLAVAGETGKIVRWHVETQQALGIIDPDGDVAVTALRSLPDGRLVAGTADGHVDTWRGEPAWSLAAQLGPPEGANGVVSESSIEDRVLAIDFSPDGTKLAIGSGIPSRTGQLMIWDLATRSIAREFPDAHSDTVFDVAFSRDGKLLASGAADKFAKVFDVETGGLQRNFEGHTGHVLSVAWKADGSVLATGGADNAIKVWTTATGEQQRTISSHRKPVTSIAFAGIEEKLISAAGDNTVMMHTVSNGRNYRSLGGATDFLHAVVVNHDESRVIAGCEDGIVRLWNGADGKLLGTFGEK